MSLILSGSDGVSDIDGTAATPAIRGTDTNTGIFFPAADTIAFSEGGAEVARFDSAGNLGIGTTNPSSKLNVVGSISIAGRGTSFAQNFPDWQIYNTSTGSSLAFGDYTNERMRIDSSGNLLVGQTSASNSSRLNVTGPSGQNIIISMKRPGENVSYLGSSTPEPFQVYDSGIVQRFVVTSAGSCQNTTGSYGTISDVKVKENIVDATPKLDKVMQLQVKNFTLKTNPELKQIGFIAQELQQVFPSLIEESEDEDEKGEKTGEVTLGVKTTVLIPILVKAIQELKATVDAQAARIAALEAAP